MYCKFIQIFREVPLKINSLKFKSLIVEKRGYTLFGYISFIEKYWKKYWSDFFQYWLSELTTLLICYRNYKVFLTSLLPCVESNRPGSGAWCLWHLSQIFMWMSTNIENKFKKLLLHFIRYRIQDDNKFHWITFAATLLCNWIIFRINFFLSKYTKSKNFQPNPFTELLQMETAYWIFGWCIVYCIL